MSSPRKIDHVGRLEVESTDADGGVSIGISRGGTAIVDADPANRTAVLDAIQFALGRSDARSLDDFDDSVIRLTLRENTFEREPIRNEEGNDSRGSEQFARGLSPGQFAFLHRSSSVRTAAADPESLRDVILSSARLSRPESETDEPSTDRAINHQLSRTHSLRHELDALRDQQGTLRDQIERMETELSTRSDDIERDETGPIDGTDPDPQTETAGSEIRTTIEDLVELRDALSAKENRLSALRSELASHRRELSELPVDSPDAVDELGEELVEARKEKQRLDQEIQNVQHVIQFNRDILEGNENDVLSDVDTADDVPKSADESASDATVSCWVCHSEVPSSRIETGLDSLQTILSKKLAKADQVENRIDELQSAKRDAADEQQRRQKLRNRVTEIESEIEQIEADVDTLTERNAALVDEITRFDTEISGSGGDPRGSSCEELLQLVLELDRAETKFDDVSQRIEELEAELLEKERLQRKRDADSDRAPASERNWAEIESRLVPEFNTTMDILLQRVDYRPLDRVWIDCQSAAGAQAPPTFRLKARRRSDAPNGEGTPVSSLRDADREVATLLFGLAGYLVHEVHADLEVLLIDSVECIGSRQVEELVEYLSGFVDYLVVGLPPGDAENVGVETVRLPDSLETSG